MTAPGVTPWVGPGWGDIIPGRGSVQDPAAVAAAISPAPGDLEFPGCPPDAFGGRPDLCVRLCRNILQQYPSDPTGCWFVNRQPDGRLALLPLWCLRTDCPNPDPVYGERKVYILDDPRNIPEWAGDPGAIARPATLLDHEWSQRALTQSPWATFAGLLERPGGIRPSGRGLSLAGVDLGDLEDVARFILGDGVDLAGVARSVLALVLSSDRIRGALDQLSPKLGERFLPALQQLAINTLEGNRELAARLSNAFDEAGDKQAKAAEGWPARLLAGVVDIIGDLLTALVEAAKAIFGPVLGEARGALANLAEAIQGVFRKQLEGQRGRLPRELDAVAAEAIGAALFAGTTAQIAGLALELAHPLKRLGLNQMVGFLADFAGFNRITGPWFNPTVKWSIGNLAEQRAAQMFRTELPSEGAAREQAWQRHIPLSDYAQNLALHGLPSAWIRVLVEDTYQDPRPREITELLNAGEADPAWIAAKLKEHGWDDGDVLRGTRALLLKATAPGRNRWIGEAFTAYRDGQISERELGGHLEAAGLIALHRDAWMRAAKLDRRGRVMERVAARVLDQYVNDLVDRVQVERQLEGLGFVREEVTARLLEGDLRREVKQVRQDEQLRDAEVRRLMAAGFENLKRQFRAGFLDLDTFLMWGQALGFSAAYIRNVADLELLKGPPSADEELPPVGLGAVRTAARELARLLEDEVRAGRVAATAVVEILGELGLDRGLARELVGAAQVLGLPLPGSLGLPFPGEDPARSAFETVMATVLERIRRGEGGIGLLDQVLERLGLPTEHRRPAADILTALEALFYRPGSR